MLHWALPHVGCVTLGQSLTLSVPSGGWASSCPGSLPGSDNLRFAQCVLPRRRLGCLIRCLLVLLELISFKAELGKLAEDWETIILAHLCSLLLIQEFDGLHTVLMRT